MRVMVLGSMGMLGHQLAAGLEQHHEVIPLSRTGFDARWPKDLEYPITRAKPDVIINCVGIVKQRKSSAEEMIEVNGLFPHRLMAMAHGARVIHFSTDCVFSGKWGRYEEDDVPDPVDLYGRTKLVGELTEGNSITLRTSIIGREKSRHHGLLDWFLLNKAKVIPGYRYAKFSGLTTLEMVRVVQHVLIKPGASGLYHVSGPPISKCDLLVQAAKAYGKDVRILPDDSVICDRTLNSDRFQRDFGYTPPSWREMLKQLADPAP